MCITPKLWEPRFSSQFPLNDPFLYYNWNHTLLIKCQVKCCWLLYARLLNLKIKYNNHVKYLWKGAALLLGSSNSVQGRFAVWTGTPRPLWVGHSVEIQFYDLRTVELRVSLYSAVVLITFNLLVPLSVFMSPQSLCHTARAHSRSSSNRNVLSTLMRLVFLCFVGFSERLGLKFSSQNSKMFSVTLSFISFIQASQRPPPTPSPRHGPLHLVWI